MPSNVEVEVPAEDVFRGLGAQFRAARALLGKSTRQVGGDIGCSAMAVSKIENGSIRRGDTLVALTHYYQQEGLSFYCGGVIRAGDAKIQEYANALRERLLDGGSGSAYVEAFDHIVARAALPHPGGSQ